MRTFRCWLLVQSKTQDYESYDRKDKVRIGVFDHSLSLNKSMSKRWNDLSDSEKDSAYQLCYFEESWDGKDLADW